MGSKEKEISKYLDKKAKHLENEVRLRETGNRRVISALHKRVGKDLRKLDGEVKASYEQAQRGVDVGTKGFGRRQRAINQGLRQGEKRLGVDTDDLAGTVRRDTDQLASSVKDHLRTSLNSMTQRDIVRAPVPSQRNQRSHSGQSTTELQRAAEKKLSFAQIHAWHIFREEFLNNEASVIDNTVLKLSFRDLESFWLKNPSLIEGDGNEQWISIVDRNGGILKTLCILLDIPEPVNQDQAGYPKHGLYVAKREYRTSSKQSGYARNINGYEIGISAGVVNAKGNIERYMPSIAPDTGNPDQDPYKDTLVIYQSAMEIPDFLKNPNTRFYSYNVMPEDELMLSYLTSIIGTL
jgi:hypothetical protein